MNEKMIIDAYCRIRTIDNTIPDDVLDFMKQAALERLQNDGKSPDFAEALKHIKQSIYDMKALDSAGVIEKSIFQGFDYSIEKRQEFLKRFK